jgi:hypothetical protein
VVLVADAQIDVAVGVAVDLGRAERLDLVVERPGDIGHGDGDISELEDLGHVLLR